MRNFFLTFWIALVVIPETGFSQGTDEPEKYWVFFTDKSCSESLDPGSFLSQRSLLRRAKQGISVDVKDFPVCETYREAIRAHGLGIEQSSKWLNAVSCWLTSEDLAWVRQQSFVKGTKLIPPVRVDYEPINFKTAYDPGYTSDQIEMIGLDVLHQQGLLGEGSLIAVMDNGFLNVDINPNLQHLHEDGRIIGTYDFVHGETNVYDQGSHGAYVLSILAGYYEDPFDPQANFVGSAPGASYLLCHTEDDSHEWHREEDNWVAAMEYADSAGADIFTTSLGYSNGMEDSVFINGQWIRDYTYQHFDGNTTIITRAADMAAARGILVINSAGNNGFLKMNAPADGDSVMAVGAVDANEQIASFSSIGPSFDGRIKPELCGMGQATVFMRTNGEFSAGNGTSFSCPMISGLAACLLQADPSLAAMELFDIMLASSDRHANPDTIYGHGIPDGALAYQMITQKDPGAIPGDDFFNDYGITLLPNPAWEQFEIVINNREERFDAELLIFDEAGRIVTRNVFGVHPFYNRTTFTRGIHFPEVSQGIFMINIRNLSTSQVIYRGKLRLAE